MFNLEWFRNPPSRLEHSLRRPWLYRYAILLFLTRPLPIWAIIGTLFWATSHRVIVSTLAGLVVTLLYELFSLRKWYLDSVLPKHLRHVERIKSMYNNLEQSSLKSLVNMIEESVKRSTWGLVHIGYMAFPSWGWEYVLQALFPVLISSPGVSYRDLLVGFDNKTTEGDQFLWHIAREKGLSKNTLLTEYLKEYGSKVDDVELALPTLREQPKVINHLIQLYQKTSSPLGVSKRAKQKRVEVTSMIVEHVRVAKTLFVKLLSIVQQNVSLREDRRHYEFLADFYTRQMVLRLAELLNIDKKEVFNVPWNQLKHRAHTEGHFRKPGKNNRNGTGDPRA